MDRELSERELIRRSLHDAYAPLPGLNARLVPSSARSRDLEIDVRDKQIFPRSKVRLDSAFHHSQSRWLRRFGTETVVKQSCGPTAHDQVAESRFCSTLVTNRPAQVLTAMVNWITTDLDNSPSFQPEGEVEDSLATIGGQGIGETTGLIRLRQKSIRGEGRFLLAHSDLAEDFDKFRGMTCPPQVERYSLNPGQDWWAGDLRGVDGLYRFRAYRHGEFCTEIRLQVPGAHQVLPALAAVAIGIRLRLTPAEIKARLEDFSGISRGFESRGSFRGATLVDDEAIGRGAVRETIRLAREVFRDRLLRAVYLPPSDDHDRSTVESSEFAEVDHLIVVNPDPLWREWTRLFVASLRSSGVLVVGCPTLDQAIRELDRYLEPGDVLVTLGAEEVGTIADAFLRRLSRGRLG